MEIFQVLLAVILFIPIILRLLLKFIVWSCKTALNLDVEIEGLMLLGLRGIKIFLPQYTLDISTLYLLFPGEGREKFRICVQGLSVVKSIRAPVIRSTSNDACQGEEVKQLSPCRLHEISKWFELEILDLNIGSELSGQHSLTSCTSKVVLRLHHSEGSQIFAADANLYTTTFAIYSDPVASVPSVFRGDSHTSSHKLILQWNTSIKAEASITEDSFSMEKLSIDISGLDVVIKENLADLMSRKYHHVKTANAQPMPERSLECIVRSLSPYIPKELLTSDPVLRGNFHLFTVLTALNAMGKIFPGPGIKPWVLAFHATAEVTFYSCSLTPRKFQGPLKVEAKWKIDF